MKDNAKNHIERNSKAYILATILVLILAICVVGYGRGYRLTNRFMIGKLGYLEMTVPTINTSIFVDESKKIVTTKDNEVVKIPFSPRNHSVIVAREGYYPWKKDFLVGSNETLVASPIFVTQNPTGEIITTNDKDYWTIQSLIVNHKTPTKINPEISADKSTAMWLEDNAILINRDGVTKTVIQPDTIIRNIEFYKDRPDAIMFSTLNAVYVIETDRSGSQNFMPIYKGQNPSFVKARENTIYIKDGSALMEVVI